MTQKDTFTWFDSNGDNVHGGVMMSFLLILECNPETKVGVQVLRNLITNAKSSAFDNNISNMLDHVASTMSRIRDLGETHDNLMKDAFEALPTAPNSECHQYFSLQKLGWQGGT